MRFETVNGQTLPRVGLQRYLLRLPREVATVVLGLCSDAVPDVSYDLLFMC